MMIRPMSAIQNDTRTITAYCRERKKPVFLTEDGEGEYVFMTREHYEGYNEMLKLRAMLYEAEEDIRQGRVFTLEEVEAYMEEWLKDEQA